MARIFLSHSSENDAEAIALRDWLSAHGWDDLFLDLDPERGLKAGARWQAVLRDAAHRCELVIFLISPAWAASKWCLGEFMLAQNLNKRIVGVIIEPTPFADLPIEMTAEWQLVDLTAGKRDHKVTVTLPRGEAKSVAFAEDGLERLRIGLMAAGLDARYFPWPPEHDPDRAPYRGLEPLQAEDAGIFFGRDGPTVTGLDTLRGLRDAAPPRLLVILGASGAGKSSFLRAGLLPRLARERQNFVPLPPIRPERAVLHGEQGLVAALEAALKDAGAARTRTDIRKAVAAGAPDVAALLTDLVHAVGGQQSGNDTDDDARKGPAMILAVDQAEELFGAEGAEEANTFLDLIRTLATADDSALIVVFTIRSESYGRLQEAKQLEGLRKVPFDLSPMPKGAYTEVIKGPARRLDGTTRALKIDDDLPDSLMADVEGGGAKDALPLLAFTLERLYREAGADGDLKLAEYEELGRVKGAIEAAVEHALKAADSDPRIPRDREARLKLLRRGLIPWLAGIDPDTGAERRRVARISEIPAESRRLIDLLVEQRLLATDVAKETGEVTIEPVHEALLRQWDLLQGWLQEDAALLSVLVGVKRAARDWVRNHKDTAWLAHGGERLRTAERLAERADLAANLNPRDLTYLAECREAERTAIANKRRLQLLLGVLGFGIFAGATFWANQDFFQKQWRWLTVVRPYMLNEVRPHVWTAEAERALEPGDSFKDCSKNCPEMVVVPPGRFMMGSLNGEGKPNEEPRHEVSFAKPFAVSKFEVTIDDWNACVDFGDCKSSAIDGRDGRGQDPVADINWNHARDFVAWLSEMTGKTYRLLSEAEWEYAARAGARTAYHWGDDFEERKANCNGCGNKWDNKGSAPVGSFGANAFGLHDVHGNVWEWVEDCYRDDYKGAPDDGSAWTDNGECETRVVRGGSWLSPPESLRVSTREPISTGWSNRHLGLRIARDLDQ